MCLYSCALELKTEFGADLALALKLREIEEGKNQDFYIK
jgi:hypothetical protein